MHHLDNFQGQVEMVNILDALKCRAFKSTFDDTALQWFKETPSRSVMSFPDLAQRFLDHFYNTVQHSLCTDDLWLVAQKEAELFRDYAKRFQLEVMKVIDLDLRTAVNILTRFCSNTPFVAPSRRNQLRQAQTSIRTRFDQQSTGPEEGEEGGTLGAQGEATGFELTTK
ncbi:hypothetical protein Taro_014014 [Colocasia esculenta]|uniref:Retrotransposon gag domain-containing protein n=1 Tax=Colocasia esculenta TaxID=4460 RepID=A0A843UI60_COLES|nr:hypothetical protein [Colocasia esculenta]